MTIVGNTTSSRTALNHLRSVKPGDGWSIQVKKDTNDGGERVRLLRRNVPLTDHYFLDVHHDPKTNTVVGLLTKDAGTCQILVDGKTGRPVVAKGGRSSSNSNNNGTFVSSAGTYGGYQKTSRAEQQRSGANSNASSGKDAGTSIFDDISSLASTAATAAAEALAGTTTTSAPPSTRRPQQSARRGGAATLNNNISNNNNNNANNNNNNPFSELSEEDKQTYLKYAIYGLGIWSGTKVLSSIFSDGLLYFLVLPGIYAYGLQTCPDNTTFDAKKEVKRVLRGHHLPEDHPAKPRRGNFLEEFTAKIGASLATEVGAATGGYSTEITPLLGGVCKHVVVTLPTLDLACEWIGCNETWYHYRTYTMSAAAAAR